MGCGVLALATMPDGCKLHPSFTPRTICISTMSKSHALLAMKEHKIGKATIRVPHNAGVGPSSATALIRPRDHHAL